MRQIRTLVTACLAAAALAAPAAAQASSPTDLMLGKINDVRARNGVRALHGSGTLSASAGAYSNWLMQADYFGHVAGIRASGSFNRLGEILAIHGGGRARIRRTVGRWLRSPGHRAVMLSSSFRYFGAGVTVGRFGGRRATIWVVHFGAH